MKFVLSFIPSFYVKTSGVKNNDDESLSIIRWDFPMCGSIKTLITQYQDRLSLRHIEKKDMESSQELNNSSILCCLYDTSKSEETWDP